MRNSLLSKNIILCVLFSTTLITSIPHLSHAGLGEAALAEVRNGFEERQADALRQQIFTPYPNVTEPFPGGVYIWNRVNFALAILYTYKDDEAPPQNFITAANQAIIDACNEYISGGVGAITAIDGGLHWQANHFVRLHELFASDSTFYPGLLSEEAEGLIRDLLWLWVSNGESLLSDADVALHNTWRLRSSENHSAMKDQLCWGGAKILRRFEPYKSMTYNDGSTAEQQYEAWTNFLIRYLRERGKRGMFIEYHSNTYTKYTSQNFYNYYDLAENPTLRELARSVLDLLWVDAALETLDNVVGGAGARLARPDDLNPDRNGFAPMMWYYYGKSGQERSLHPGVMMLLTSDYRIPDVIMDIALDTEGREPFEYISRKPGLNVEGKEDDIIDGERRTWINYSDSKILRYSYVTSDFVLGTHMFPNLPSERWARISSQNRFHSALLRTESGYTQIVPQGWATTNNNRGYNEQWSIQKYGTLITQKLRSSERIAEMRVYIPSDEGVTVEEQDDWIFIDTGYTFSGVRVVNSGYQWQDANWIELVDQYSPVIVEVARSADYENFAAFKNAAMSTSLTVITDSNLRRLEYTGLNNSGDFVFHIDTGDMPTIDGVSYDLSPEYTYKSPYLNAEWPASTVHIEKDGRSLTLDFDLNVSSNDGWIDTGDWLGSIYDLGSPWYYSLSLANHIFLPEGAPEEAGGWIYIPAQ